MTAHPEADSWQPDTTPVLDRGALTSHINDLGVELVRQIAEKYLDDAPSSVAAVRAALDAQDLPLLQRLIHRLGGGAQTVGLEALSQQARKAEHALRAGRDDEGKLEAARLLARVDGDLAALEEFRASLKG
ncbi:Hpt domain-containing protein [Nitrospirillum iridis]|uniref:HPt (Histidine-containing phosphotransfer) domain-containing protein n=1 Tax=Nitrospirillum iridis TaxID=765888 RepID=A0A7X0B364_9PROT|nr:Hpt domain-containing protein [Nitrospirillum iridis]MBB6253855.1 HPt (histidine-containing phosphotransfer) domain-containing protein [Nitrospirillum iridis]